eukprot:6480154-Amphidinium_carterae.3
MQTPSARNYALANVERQTSASACLYEDFIALTTAEFTKTFGQAPKAKDPKVLVAYICNGKLAVERLYIFRDEKQVGRRLRVATSVGDSLTEQVMAADSHMHAEQGAEYMKWSSTQRLEAAHIQDLTLSSHGAVTVAEYNQKLHKKGVPNVVSQASCAGTMEGSAGAEGTLVAVEDEDGDDDDDLAQGEDRVVFSSAAPCMKLPSCFTAPETPAQERKRKPGPEAASQSTAGKKQAMDRSVSQSSLPDDLDADNVEKSSVLGSLASWKSGGSTHKLPAAEQVQMWIGKLDVGAILVGRKLGVVRNHAEAAAAKLPTKEKLQLSAHITLTKHAANLAPDIIDTKTKEEVSDSIAALGTAFLEMQWPYGLQDFIFNRDCKELLVHASTIMEKTGLEQLWERIKPCKSAHDEQVLDLRKARVADMSLSVSERIKKFKQLMIDDFLLALLLNGQSK